MMKLLEVASRPFGADLCVKLGRGELQPLPKLSMCVPTVGGGAGECGGGGAENGIQACPSRMLSISRAS